jgi:hypothetical protein
MIVGQYGLSASTSGPRWSTGPQEYGRLALQQLLLGQVTG